LPEVHVRWSFRPAVVPTLLAAVGVIGLAGLGAWQLGRLRGLEASRARYASRLAEAPFDAAGAVPADPDRRRAWVEGTPDWDRRMVLLNRFLWSTPGVNWVVPVRTAVGRTVLVDVGWVPADEQDAVLARERAVPAPRRYEGLARVPERGRGVARIDDAGSRWAWVDVPAMRAAVGADGPDLVLVEGEGLGADEGIRDRAPPVGGWRRAPPERPHGQYALTWFSLAVTLLGVWASASFRREETASPPT
jgi:surfeit locus 1 family protein